VFVSRAWRCPGTGCLPFPCKNKEISACLNRDHWTIVAQSGSKVEQSGMKVVACGFRVEPLPPFAVSATVHGSFRQRARHAVDRPAQSGTGCQGSSCDPGTVPPAV